VKRFRRELEAGKGIFFREFESTGEWEEMFREHLVAYLDGLRRWSLDTNFQNMDHENALLLGRFLGEGLSHIGSRVQLQVDLDGDGYEETVKFWYSHGGYSLCIEKFDKIVSLDLPSEISEDSERLHVAIKDVTNDGLPEIILAFSNRPGSLNIAI